MWERKGERKNGGFGWENRTVLTIFYLCWCFEILWRYILKAPPLTIDEAQIGQAADIIEDTIAFFDNQ